MTGEMNGIMGYILEKASTSGGLLERFFGTVVLLVFAMMLYGMTMPTILSYVR